MKSDIQLHKDVLDELAFEPQLDATHIGIAVKDGIVTLTGEVASYADRWTAERVVKRVSGVHGVVEEIHVNLPEHHQRGDTEIAETAMNALIWDINVPHEAIQMKVEGGWVTLTGEVTWNFQRNHAESAVRYLSGVKGITNLITVQPDAQPMDVKARIEREFQRRAQLESANIQTVVRGSTVILQGHVSTWQAREEAEAAAWSAPGVREVVNELRVHIAETDLMGVI